MHSGSACSFASETVHNKRHTLDAEAVPIWDF